MFDYVGNMVRGVGYDVLVVVEFVNIFVYVCFINVGMVLYVYVII